MLDEKEKFLISELRHVASRLSASHDKARYEGDGDPGCYLSCQACLIKELLNLLKEFP